MTNHFKSIGFAIEDDDDLQRYMGDDTVQGETCHVDGGRYILWPSDHATQLWLQVDNENDLVGLNPHYVGKASMRVKIEERLERDVDNPLDGGLRAWANPTPGGESGEYPLVFDVPDFAAWSLPTLPAIAEVQLTAFAHTLVAHPSEAAFLAAQGSDWHFAPKSFVPTGLFNTADNSDTQAPPAQAMFNGVVRETALLTNPITGTSFRWAWVSTLGGEIDVVATPDEIEGEVVAGGVVEVSGWLSGAITSLL